MHSVKIHISSLLFVVISFTQITWSQNTIQDEVDWDKFIFSHDMVFETIPRKWEEVPYFANGFIGSMIYADMLVKMSLKFRFSLPMSMIIGGIVLDELTIPSHDCPKGRRLLLRGMGIKVP